MYRDIQKDYFGEWMKLDNFSFHIVYDARNKEKKALQQQFKSENTFKLDVDVWEDRPFI